MAANWVRFGGGGKSRCPEAATGAGGQEGDRQPREELPPLRVSTAPERPGSHRHRRGSSAARAPRVVRSDLRSAPLRRARTPEFWSCQATILTDDGSFHARVVVYDPTKNAGAAPAVGAAAIAIDADQVWHATALVCSVFAVPGSREIGPTPVLRQPVAPSRRSTIILRPSSIRRHPRRRVGTRCCGRETRPVSLAMSQRVSVLTCRPTTGLTAADCDTVVADYVARVGNEATPSTPLPAPPSVATGRLPDHVRRHGRVPPSGAVDRAAHPDCRRCDAVRGTSRRSTATPEPPLRGARSEGLVVPDDDGSRRPERHGACRAVVQCVA